jgi:hypothetical protein
MSSPLAVLRVFGVQSLWLAHGQKELSTSQVVQELAPLSEAERRQVLAEWVGELRVTANQQGGQESGDLRQERLALVSSLIQIWPRSIEQSEFRKLTRRCSGPLPGGWAVSTDVELLQPLERQGLISSDDSLGIWTDTLFDLIRPPKLPEQEQRRQVQYFPAVDIGLSKACVSALARASSAARHEWLDRYRRLVDVPLKDMRQPLLRSRKYTLWFDNIQVLLRLRALVALAVVSLRNAGLPQEEVEPFQQQHGRLRDAASSQLLRDTSSPLKALADFVDEADASAEA